MERAINHERILYSVNCTSYPWWHVDDGNCSQTTGWKIALFHSRHVKSPGRKRGGKLSRIAPASNSIGIVSTLRELGRGGRSKLGWIIAANRNRFSGTERWERRRREMREAGEVWGEVTWWGYHYRGQRIAGGRDVRHRREWGNWVRRTRLGAVRWRCRSKEADLPNLGVAHCTWNSASIHSGEVGEWEILIIYYLQITCSISENRNGSWGSRVWRGRRCKSLEV